MNVFYIWYLALTSVSNLGDQCQICISYVLYTWYLFTKNFHVKDPVKRCTIFIKLHFEGLKLGTHWCSPTDKNVSLDEQILKKKCLGFSQTSDILNENDFTLHCIPGTILNTNPQNCHGNHIKLLYTMYKGNLSLQSFILTKSQWWEEVYLGLILNPMRVQSFVS